MLEHVSAEDTRNSPGASTWSCSTTPSLTTIEKRWPRVPRPNLLPSMVRPMALAERAVAVGEHGDDAVRAARLAPGAQHEGIVDGSAGDDVDALGLERVRFLDEAGQMLGRAGRREGAGDGEKRDFLAGEEVRALDLFGAAFGQGDEGRFGQGCRLC